MTKEKAQDDTLSVILNATLSVILNEVKNLKPLNSEILRSAQDDK